MKIILSPSKTMKYQKNTFELSSQIFPNETQHLHSLLSKYNEEELCELMKISYKQATQVYHYFHDDYKSCSALALYTGTVFKQLQIEQYYDHIEYLDEHVRILSAYYGILKYNTAIKPYRLDMTIKPQQINLYEYWYTPLYQYFKNEDFIISLASKEFSQMIHHDHIYFIDFIEIKDGKQKRNSMIIKKARGRMLHEMIINEISTIEQLQNLCIDGFSYDESLSHCHNLAFVKK